MGSEPTARRDHPLPEGIEVREGARGARIRLVFSWHGERRRETLDVPATPANIKYASRLRAEVLNAIERGSFDYLRYFPNSKTARLASLGKQRHLVNALLDNYIDHARKAKILSPSSVATYVKWARSRLKPQFDGRYIDDLTTPELRDWIVNLATELAPKSVRNCVGLLSNIIGQAAIDGLIAVNPLAAIKLRQLIPKRKKENDKIDPFNAVEITAILDACGTIEERALFQYAFNSGLRTGELIGVKWAHIDWRGRLVLVQNNVVTGEKCTVEKDTKTGPDRMVPFLPAAEAALLAIKPLTRMKQAGDYIFLSPEGTRWRNDQHIRAAWKRILVRAKVRYRNPYQTRHTFASTLLANGEDERMVAMLLGHTTVEMVRRHYGRYIKQPDGKITFRGDYSEQLGASAPNAPQVSGKAS